MRIVFDMDGVLTSFEKNVYLVSEELFPGRMPKNYVPSDWNYSDVFTKKDWNSVWERIKSIPNFWMRQPEIPEAVQALQKFRRENDDQIWFITSRTSTGGVSARYQTQLWLLQRQLINLTNLEEVIAVSKPEEKQQFVIDLGIDVSIDDFGPTIECHIQIPNHKAYLLDQPWNRQYKNLDGVRIYSVQEFLEKIKIPV